MQSFSLLRERLLQPLQGESDLEDFGFFKLRDNFLAAHLEAAAFTGYLISNCDK